MKRRLTAMTGSAVLALAGLVPGSAHAQGTTRPGTEVAAPAANPCFVWFGGTNNLGDHHFMAPIATRPPSQGDDWSVPGIYQPKAVRLSARQTMAWGIGGLDMYGYVVIGDALYYSYYQRADDYSVRYKSLSRVGGGWGSFTYLEVSSYETPDGVPKFTRTTSYALRSDGVLYRWNISAKVWRASGSYPGFSSVKTMTLIAKTPTYDTFLANTRGGALYTIRIPTAAPMKPLVTRVRTSGWQAFETLSAEGCGRNSTLLFAVDQDTLKAYLYAVGHANGLSTLIESRGRVDGNFWDPVHFRWTQPPIYDIANGD
jgi:hypothetical protein